jgi:hypothetical protein
MVGCRIALIRMRASEPSTSQDETRQPAADEEVALARRYRMLHET